jgi:hypothetical protein
MSDTRKWRNDLQSVKATFDPDTEHVTIKVSCHGGRGHSASFVIDAWDLYEMVTAFGIRPEDDGEDELVADEERKAAKR